MTRRVSAARVRSNRSYTVEEAAEAVGVTAQTVRLWIRRGLPAMTGQRPFLILGGELKDFVSRERDRRKRPLSRGEFFCLRCKAATTPALGLVEYRPMGAASGRVHGFCAVCEGSCSLVISAARLPDWASLYEIAGNVAPQP